MKQTPFFAIHRKLGAKMVEFGGYDMPIQYTGILEEHKAVRGKAGVFDVSHMGEFEIRGADAQAFVQRMTTNDASKLTEGKAQYSSMCYADGGIVDDLLVYRFEEHFMLVVNAANIGKDLEWLKSNRSKLRVEIVDRSDETALLAVQGPRSEEILQKLTPSDLSQIPYYSFVRTKVAGIPMTLSRTGYTGESGFEIYFAADIATAERVWNALMEAGKDFGIKPVGLGARDTLRLEMGYCLYGNDIDATTNPLEAGLSWITKLEKGDFIGRDALVKIKQEGVKRKLIGFVVEGEKAFPRQGYEIRLNGSSLGHVTSGTVSPVLDKGIGLGYVDSGAAQPGSRVNILIREKDVAARVEKVPFIKKVQHAG
ncbi:MAG: glycine cleavage system protein T [Ignavibacteria bacterium 13_1_40CM_2_61_4]|nr:MAG: glycine cleavage system protein T [Ignavibacteria bacterium 13_1_40CM_2_61_4]